MPRSPSRNGGPSTFFPCETTPHLKREGTPISAFLAKQESLRPAILRCAAAARGAG
jgi:hypothetical protein